MFLSRVFEVHNVPFPVKLTFLGGDARKAYSTENVLARVGLRHHRPWLD
jgi:hypothetical protein